MFVCIDAETKLRSKLKAFDAQLIVFAMHGRRVSFSLSHSLAELCHHVHASYNNSEKQMGSIVTMGGHSTSMGMPIGGRYKFDLHKA